MYRRPPCSILFPYTTLFRSVRRTRGRHRGPGPRLRDELDQEERPPGQDRLHLSGGGRGGARGRRREAPHLAWLEAGPDRKSTRLNSSHVSISYAVFCLKKKN